MRLLIVGPLHGQVTVAAKIALAQGAKVAQADDVDGALATLRAGHGADLVMIDVQLDVGRFVAALRAERICVPVVACGIEADAAAAVRAIKAGAREYIPLPPEPDLIAAVFAAVAQDSHAIIFRDRRVGDLLKLADQVAPSEASILIGGESGTGKELLARYIHRKSRRSKQPMVSVNCAAIPENLLESELFGHEKGAFTGAIARRIGKFEEANGGTLLLDEISEMDVRLQAKLLRTIQEREIDRVGGAQPVKVDIRLIATTNRNLEADARAGRFREDLLYRLNVVTLVIPPLRDRPEDIDELVSHFIRRYSELNGVAERPISAEASAMLHGHSWRGNVRELENTIHRAVLLAADNVIGPSAILLNGAARNQTMRETGTAAATPGVAADAVRAALVGRTVADVERDLILETLNHCLGNRTHAANILGISIRTLRNKLKLYGGQNVSVSSSREAHRASL